MENYKIENLTFSYPNSKRAALDNISLVINSGEFVTICGKSGCGKSTLLKSLKPILAPCGEASGKIYFEGRELSELSQTEQCENIGFVLQSPDNQIVTDKVWHELAFGLESLSYSNTRIRAQVAEMASFFGIQEWFHKKTTELSGGQKQLLNLASVMVMKPKVLILDEPTSQLDPIAAQEFLQTLLKINREIGTTIILSEHRLEEAFAISDRIIVMENGTIAADGSPREVGKILWQSKNDMYEALPTPMRVYYGVSEQENCPLTVCDARQWLESVRGDIKREVPPDKKADLPEQTSVLLNDVWFRYEKDMPDVIKRLSLQIKKGEFYAIVGGNGTGKTTSLSVIGEFLKPYRGKTSICGKVVMLPQNPQVLFTRKTVLLDLLEMKSAEEERKEIISLCELEELLDMHPHDLSGGEQQRAALAKVLLTKPDILLLDEPTKGLDAHFKQKLASILISLKQSGVTVIMVSHDIEFCARYADRCGMFFDGSIVSEGTPREIFSGNSFYTTAAGRIAGDIINQAILCEEILYAFGNDMPKTEKIKYIKRHEPEKTEEDVKMKDKKISIKNIIFGILFFVLFVAAEVLFHNKFSDYRSYIFQISSIILLGLSIICFIPRKYVEFKEAGTKQKGALSKRTVLSIVTTLILIPLTIFIGVYYLGDRKYYFISLLIILETLLPFLIRYENKKPAARELVVIAALCAIAVAGRAAFYMLPQFKPVVAIVIISGICFGAEAGFLVGAMTGFVSNFFFGQGGWTPWQMFAFGIIGFLAGVLFKKGFLRKTKGSLCVFGGFAVLIVYGLIMNSSTVILWQPNPTTEMFLSSYAMGLPFDVIHAVSTMFFLWFIAAPMIEKLDRIKLKYGIMNIN